MVSDPGTGPLSSFMFRLLLLFKIFMLVTVSASAGPVIKRIAVNGKTIAPLSDGTLHLKSSAEDVMIEFESVPGDSVVYAYHFSGQTAHWYHTIYPSVRFGRLSGGTHRLTFRADKNAADKTPVIIRIEVMEAFWQKWWFWPVIILYVLLVGGIAFYLFFLYNVRQKLRLQHVRNQIASDLHDEVGSNLSSIAIFVELLRKKTGNYDKEIQPILDRITNNSEETVSLMRDTVWAIHPDNDSTDKLLLKMRSFGAEVLSAKSIEFEFTSPDNLPRDIFTMEQRRNIYLVYKEAVNNIAKHSGADAASCHFTRNHKYLNLSISDNGKGFNPDEAFEGNGLKNFAQRSKEDAFTVTVSSAPGSGTNISMTILT